MVNPLLMQEAGAIVRKILRIIKKFIKVGISTASIDRYCQQKLNEYQVRSAALHYGNPPFPGTLCIAVNDVVCHGYGKEHTYLKAGDLVSIDLCIEYNGVYADSCISFALSPVAPEVQRLIDATEDTMYSAISAVRAGITVSKLGMIMENTAKKYGYQVVHEFAGHGIGTKLHCEPCIPFYYDQNYSDKLRAGQYITIEPMLLATREPRSVKILPDQWTAVVPGILSAQFEHTIYVKEKGYDIIT